MDGNERSLFDRITLAIPGMRPSERKVADIVAGQPERVLSLGISALAAASDVSDPTVLRFCRGIGFQGYQDFKLGLARSLALSGAAVRRDIAADDKVPAFVTKVCAQTSAALRAFRETTDWGQLERAIEVLALAPRIECHGVGASGAVAIDAQNKLFRLGVPVTAYVDPHMQAMSAASLNPGDVLISFSYTGRAREILASARIAREQGVDVVAVTVAGTPLADIASHPICLPRIEDTDQYTPGTSRLLQLIVVDVLEIGVAQKRGPGLSPKLRRIKDVLQQVREANSPADG